MFDDIVQKTRFIDINGLCNGKKTQKERTFLSI